MPTFGGIGFGSGAPAEVDTYALAAPTITTLGTDTIYTFTQDGATVLVLTVPVQATVSTLGRGLFGGGSANSNVIDFVTIASAGNATDFGDLTVARQYLAACSSTTRGLFGGGYGSANSNVIDFVTIATTGNATDFGDLTVTRHVLAGLSNSHGGLI